MRKPDFSKELNDKAKYYDNLAMLYTRNYKIYFFELFCRDLIGKFEESDPNFLPLDFAIIDCLKLISFFAIKFSMSRDSLNKIMANNENKRMMTTVIEIILKILNKKNELFEREKKNQDENAYFYLFFFLILGILRCFLNEPSSSHLNKQE